MQKTFIAIALALTLTCAFAYTNPITAGYVKAPVSVVADSEVNFTNSSGIQLVSATIGELDILAANVTANLQNLSANTWNTVYRKLDGKALTASTNSTSTFTSGLTAFFLNGYVVSLGTDNDTNNVPQISVYQTPISGGNALARIFASSNNNTSWTPKLASIAIISKTVYVFYLALNNSNQVNVTNFVVGGSKGSLEFTLTTAYNGSLSVAWGEALGSSQLFANWIDGTVLKDGQIDVSKGTVTANVVGAWVSGYVCHAFSTDKKWFGDLCTSTNATAGTINYYVRSNTSSLAPLTNNNTNTSSFLTVVPYGPYIAIVYTDSVTTQGNTTYSYDIWNLDTFTTYRNRTAFLTSDSLTTSLYRVTSGGLYTLTSNKGATVNGTVTNFTSIQVGLVLGSSALTSVLAFLMTVVAGLLLF